MALLTFDIFFLVVGTQLNRFYRLCPSVRRFVGPGSSIWKVEIQAFKTLIGQRPKRVDVLSDTKDNVQEDESTKSMAQEKRQFMAKIRDAFRTRRQEEQPQWRQRLKKKAELRSWTVVSKGWWLDLKWWTIHWWVECSDLRLQVNRRYAWIFWSNWIWI